MDIFSFDTRQAAAEGVWIDVLDASGNAIIGSDGAPVKFLVRGGDAPGVRGGFAKAAKVSETGDEVAYGQSLQTADAQASAKLLAGWSDNFTAGGQRLEFTPANALRLMEVPLFRDQVAAAALNRALFTRKTNAQPAVQLGTVSG